MLVLVGGLMKFYVNRNVRDKNHIQGRDNADQLPSNLVIIVARKFEEKYLILLT